MPPSKNQASVATKIQCVLNIPNSTVSYIYRNIYGDIFRYIWSCILVTFLIFPTKYLTKKLLKSRRIHFGSRFEGLQSAMNGKAWWLVAVWQQKHRPKLLKSSSHLSGTWSRRTQEVGHGYRPQGQPAVIHLLQLYPTSSNHTLNWGPSVQIHGPVGDILHTDQGSLSFVIWWLITMVSLMRFRRVHLWGII